MLGGERLGGDLGELLRQVGQRPLQLEGLEGRDQQVARADLRLAVEERGVVPAAVQEVHHHVGDAGHLGLVAPEVLHHGADVGEEPRPVELEVVAR
jgi:hypothetical protein